MIGLKKKFFKQDIPFFIKNSIVDVFKNDINTYNSTIFMEFIPGSKL